MTQHLIKGEIVEDFNQHRVRDRQRGSVTRKKFIVVLLRSLVWYHIEISEFRKQPNEEALPISRATQIND